MTKHIIERRLELHASPERVWKAISEPGEISQWFGDATEIDLRPGGDGAFLWTQHGRFAMRVEEVDAPRRLVWSWVHEADVAFDDAPSTRVEWDLESAEGGGTVLRLRESGFLTELHHQQNTEGWGEELGELVEYVDL